MCDVIDTQTYIRMHTHSLPNTENLTQSVTIAHNILIDSGRGSPHIKLLFYKGQVLTIKITLHQTLLF